ncbi:SDR family NAD(P)-dependent oxidoreductase [Polaromonas eurypsychrophila]|uniref:Uncharacterized protein n=1 Tax=Polaromonas eurypsychrophila TaxID=1614635 RepID=A0A916SB97_9BURK|nr:SDR family NAD(P)-dependent oxidoreductase [Polaromonas eurypsychrophila]GGA92120.1 hypothetical protein GCM10011496_11380 [Polaromonas eurypsychrophila]
MVTGTGTGTGTGIGRGIALVLAAQGLKRATSARRVALLDEVAEDIVSRGGHRPVVIASELCVEDAAKTLTDAALAGLGRVGILVNSAGGSRSFAELHVSEDRWQEAITLNFYRLRQVA